MQPGTDVELTCMTKRIPRWFFNGTLPLDKFSNTYRPAYNKIVICDLNEKDTGKYKCVGSVEDDDRFHAEMQLFVTGTHYILGLLKCLVFVRMLSI